MMEIIADRQQLSSHLQKIQSILEKSSSLSKAENILLKTTGDRLEIIAYDQNCSARGIQDIEIKQPGSISVNGRKIFDLVRSLSDAKVSIRQESESSLILIEDTKSSFKILSADVDEFPEIDFNTPAAYLRIDSHILSQLIDLTVFSVAKIADPRYNLQGVFLEIDPVNGLSENETETMEKEIAAGSHFFSLIATDGHRVSVARTTEVSGRINLGERKIFSRKSLQEIRSVFNNEEMLNLGFSHNEVVVWGDEFILILRMLQGDFPDYRKMIPEHFSHRLVVDREALLNTLKQMNLLAQEQYKGVIFDIVPGSMKISINNPEMGHGHTEMVLDYQGDPVKIGFNISYLMDFLQALPDQSVVFFINDKTQPCLIKGDEHEDYMCGIMPIS
ncbi:MAG: DNA polymerase III subunit beta [Deltaproteobacteria bacterium]|nr:DNA polymerase III subunit beta [Deltaproteobacteria bacterium]